MHRKILIVLLTMILVYGVFLSIDASEMKKLYDYKDVVLYR